MTEHEFQDIVVAGLAYREKPGAGFEARLFGSAYELLERRRSKFARVPRNRPAASPLKPWIFNPAAQLAALALLLSGTLVLRLQPQQPELTFSDLPELSKTNPTPERYDAQWLAERQAHDKEIEDAHEKTSGGA